MSKHVKLALFIVCVLWVFLSAPFASASSPTKVKLSVEWQHYLPGVSSTSVIQTSDGGYLALGLNASTILFILMKHISKLLKLKPIHQAILYGPRLTRLRMILTPSWYKLYKQTTGIFLLGPLVS
jgi:hypothetical protein